MTLIDVIQARSALEPLDLLIIIGVLCKNLLRSSILVMKNNLQGHARSKVIQSEDIDPVLLLNEVVIFRIGKC